MKELQEKVIRKYGFENWRTVLIFKLAEALGK